MVGQAGKGRDTNALTINIGFRVGLLQPVFARELGLGRGGSLGG